MNIPGHVVGWPRVMNATSSAHICQSAPADGIATHTSSSKSLKMEINAGAKSPTALTSGRQPDSSVMQVIDASKIGRQKFPQL